MPGIQINIDSAGNPAGITATASALTELSAAFERAASAASSASAQLSTAAGSFGNLSTMMGHAANSTTTLGGRINELGETIRTQTSFGGVFERFGGILGNIATTAENMATGGVSMLTGAFHSLSSAVMGFVGNSVQMLGMVAVFEEFSHAASFVNDLKQQMISLNETQQQQQVGWAYLFGSQAGPNYAASSQMLGWTAKESYNMPFTRQDMNSAISTLQTLGLSPEAIQHYLPILADLAVRNPGMSLERIAMSVMGAQFGLTRMLRYDLRITPEQLQQYGLDFAEGRHIDPKTLLPALENFARAQGYYEPTAQGDMGASWMLAHNTFQGAMTSWQDRYQNFLLQLGGTYWEDQTSPDQNVNTADINAQEISLQAQIANIRQKGGRGLDQRMQLQALLQKYGSGVSVRNLLAGTPGHENEGQYVTESFAQAGDVRQGSIFDMMITGLRTITDWWDHNQDAMNKMADLFGNIMGLGIKSAGQALQGFLSGLNQTNAGAGILKDVQDILAWLADPKHQAEIQAMGKSIGEHVGKAIIETSSAVKDLAKDWDGLLKALSQGGAGGGAFDVFVKGLDWVIEQVGRFGLVLADIAKIVNDLKKGDFGAAASDAAQLFGDLANLGTGGAAGIIAGTSGVDKTVPKGAAGGGVDKTVPGNFPQGAGAIGGGAKQASGINFGGPSTSYGDSNTAVYIYGADSRAVMAIVDAAATNSDTTTLLATRSIGYGRFRSYGTW